LENKNLASAWINSQFVERPTSNLATALT
jgi:hypothetical protein